MAATVYWDRAPSDYLLTQAVQSKMRQHFFYRRGRERDQEKKKTWKLFLLQRSVLLTLTHTREDFSTVTVALHQNWMPQGPQEW